MFWPGWLPDLTTGFLIAAAAFVGALGTFLSGLAAYKRRNRNGG